MSNVCTRFRLASIAALIVFISVGQSARAQTQTVGLFLNDARAQDGYTLFAPIGYTSTYLIDNRGLLVREWTSNARPGLGAYLTESGHLLRPEVIQQPALNGGGASGRIREWDWDGTLLWTWEYISQTYRLHHDIEVLPNGNILAIAWERKTREEALAAGRSADLLKVNELWADHILEIRPIYPDSAEIVWEWHAWDHLIQDEDASKPNYGVVAEHPERISINYPNDLKASRNMDWMHTNGIAYNAAFDQIMISVRDFNEVWVIDHSTTTAEAAGSTGGTCGKGGDLLYRWGNPEAYDTGGPEDQKLFLHHDAHWIENGKPGEGNILVFNNGKGRPGEQNSSVDEFVPPVDARGFYLRTAGMAFGPDSAAWSYEAPVPTDFYAFNISGAQRQANGNTLICNGPWGEIFEVTPEKEIVWRYVVPVTQAGPVKQGTTLGGGVGGTDNQVFRAPRYTADFPGFAGRDLTAGDPVELDPISSVSDDPNGAAGGFALLGSWPNPFSSSTRVSINLPATQSVTLVVTDMLGREVHRLIDGRRLTVGSHTVSFHSAALPAGSYVLQLRAGDTMVTRRIQILR
jgi:hypothetical protein